MTGRCHPLDERLARDEAGVVGLAGSDDGVDEAPGSANPGKTASAEIDDGFVTIGTGAIKGMTTPASRLATAKAQRSATSPA